MSKSNKKARQALERIYGKGCFIERMGIRSIAGAKTIDKQITYHHLRKREHGGETSVENGANLAWGNHKWLHSLPPKKQADLNNQIRAWKLNFLVMNGRGEVQNGGQLTFPHLTSADDCIIIEAEDTTKEQYEELEQQKEQRKRKFNRAQVKREWKKQMKEDLEDFLDL